MTTTFRCFAVALCAITLTACGDDASPSDAGNTSDVISMVDAATDASQDVATDASSTRVELRFEAVVGSMPFSCASTFSNLGTTMATWTPSDFRFYVHDVALVTESGSPVPVTLDQDGTWQYQNVALLDFENHTGTCSNGTDATNTSIRGTHSAPAGTRFTGLRFTLGVPQALNHRNPATAPSPLNLSTLFWAWQSGYKFLRIDGRTTVPGFNIHLGSTGCTGDPMAGSVSCTRPNRPMVTLTGFDPTQSVVVADLARLVTTTDVNVSTGAPGCMSDATDPECLTIMPTLGIAMGGGDPPTQTFFRVR